VAIEDSPTGVTAALASGARTIAVPLMLPIVARPGLSRVASLTDVDLDVLARVAAGEVVDTLEPAPVR
jgi:beta-phosphoglucomutase-like phosphatase (HAD superfamily)